MPVFLCPETNRKLRLSSVSYIIPLAFVVKSKNSDNADDSLKADLINMCQKELPEYVQPIDIVFIDTLPLTPIGKVDYRALEKQAEEINNQ